MRWQDRRLLYLGAAITSDFASSGHTSQPAHGAEAVCLNVAASDHDWEPSLYLNSKRRWLVFRAPSAQLVPTGYVSNLIVGQAVSGLFTHALLDSRAHASLRDASQFLHCPVRSFEHGNSEDLARRARAWGRGAKVLVMTDGMFAYDGSAAPLRQYRDCLPASAWLLVDDVHGRVLGRTGRGTLSTSGSVLIGSFKRHPEQGTRQLRLSSALQIHKRISAKPISDIRSITDGLCRA